MPVTALPLQTWRESCDTLHGHTQYLGKLAALLAPSEPRLQHAALRIGARGWETGCLPAPDGSGSLMLSLDLRAHEAVAEHSDGRVRKVALAPDRSVGAVTRELHAHVTDLVGDVPVDMTPNEVPWTVALDRDEEHARYDPVQVGEYFDVATEIALALAEFRAPHRGPGSPVNAWWGSFDIAVSLLAQGEDGVELAVGWWPGDDRHPAPALYAYASPAPEGFSEATLEPPGSHWSAELGEFLLDWRDVAAAGDPRARILAFARSAQAAAGL